MFQSKVKPKQCPNHIDNYDVDVKLSRVSLLFFFPSSPLLVSYPAHRHAFFFWLDRPQKPSALSFLSFFLLFYFSNIVKTTFSREEKVDLAVASLKKKRKEIKKRNKKKKADSTQRLWQEVLPFKTIWFCVDSFLIHFAFLEV